MIDNTTILIVSAAASVTYGGDPGALIALGGALLPPLALQLLSAGAWRGSLGCSLSSPHRRHSRLDITRESP
jgi:hypothetical protein